MRRNWPLLGLVLAALFAVAAAEMSVFTVGDKDYPCFPQISAPRDTSPEVLRNGPLEIQVVRLTSDDCFSQEAVEDIKAEDLLNEADLQQVNGKVAVFEICRQAGSRDEYWLDYFRKSLALQQAGAVMLIAAEAYIAKIPEHMDLEITATLGVPVCVMERGIFNRLDEAANGSGSSVSGDFSSFELYSPYGEPELDSPITSLKVTEMANGQPLDVLLPAATATFNPDTSPEMTAQLIPLELNEDCYNTQSEDWDACVRCWSSGSIGNSDGPVANFHEISGIHTVNKDKILFVPLLGQGVTKGHASTCYNYFYHWGVFGAALLAEAVVIGGSANDVVTVAGPYLVGSKTVPTFAVISMHSTTMSQLLTEGDQAQQNITMRVPELSNRQGPPFYAPMESEPGLTDIGIWDTLEELSGGDGVDNRHFDCLAGQAIYNPQSFPGYGAPNFEADGSAREGSGTRVVYVRPSDECGSASNCLECLRPETKKLSLDMASYEDAVIVLNEADFPCFHKHSEFSEAAKEASPGALLVGQMGQSRHTIMDDDVPTMDFPTFTLDSSCGERIVGLCRDDGSPGCPQGVYVQLPPIVDGVAREYTTFTEEDELPEAAVKFTNPSDLAAIGPVLVGQANFNPKDYPALNDREVVLAQTQPECNSEETCLECDLMPWRWTLPKGDYEGKVAMFSLYQINPRGVFVDEVDGSTVFNFRGFAPQGTCLMPWSNIVKDMEDAGAVAVLFMDGDDTIRTLVQRGVPHDVKIPSFNIPVSLGREILAREFLSDTEFFVSRGSGDQIEVKVDLPRLSGGVAMSNEEKEVTEGDVFDPADDLPRADELANSGLVFPKWAIAVAAAGGVLFLLGAAAIYYFCRRNRRMFAYNQMDCAVQADAMLDIMSLPPEDNNEGFTDEPLNNPESSPGILASSHSLRGKSSGAMQMVDMLPKKNHQDMGVGP